MPRMFSAWDGPPLLGKVEREHLESLMPDLIWVGVPGTDHAGVLLSEQGAKACADAMVAFLS